MAPRLHTGDAVMRTMCLRHLRKWSVLLFSSLLILTPASLRALTIDLAWDANPENNLTGYNLYYGNSSGTYSEVISVGKVTSYSLTLPDGGTYFFALTAVNTEGLESDFSNEASYVGPNTAPTVSTLTDRAVNEDSSTGAITFTVGDLQTPLNSLQVTATSSDQTVVANSGLVLGGTGATRSLTVTPVANASGTSTITVRVSDGALNVTSAFVLTVNAVNDAPTLSAIANQTITEDTGTTALPITIADVDDLVTDLNLRGSSSNPTLVPTSGIVFGGSGANRTVQVIPAANQSGTATVTVRVDDGSLTNSRAFTVTVNPVNDGPTISAIADQVIAEDGVTGVLPFVVYDADTAISNVTLTASSGNTTVVPNGRITLGGSGTNRTVQVRPATNQIGTAVITLRAGDGTVTNTRSFTVTVTDVNDPPTISAIANQTVNEDTPFSVIAFTISDNETPGGLSVTASSANEALVPSGQIDISGTGTNRTLTFLPATNQFGATTLTVFVNDGQTTVSRSFGVTVRAVDDEPEVSPFADITLDRNTSSGPIPFTISDVDTPLASLSVTATSTNTTLVPNSNLILGGSGANRTITVVPANNQTGTTRIAVRVSDGTTTNRQFLFVTVANSNSAPSLNVPAQVNAAKKTAVYVVGSVQDSDAGNAPITVTFRARYGNIKLILTVPNGVSAAEVQGNNSTNVTVTAPLADINRTWARTNGVTYTGLANFVGLDGVTVSVNDNGNSGAGGPRTDTKITAVNVVGNKIDHWRTQYFGTDALLDPAKEVTQWGDVADPDMDGCSNLFEYALGLDPTQGDDLGNVITPGTLEVSGSRYLTLTFNRRLGDPFLQYLPEVSGDQQSWSAGAIETSVTPLSADFERVTYRDITPITDTAPRYMRLRMVNNSL